MMPDMPDMQNMSEEQMKKMAEQMQAKEYEGLTPEEIEEKKRQKEEEKQHNMAVLDETLALCKDKDDPSLKDIRVFLPEEVQVLQAVNPEADQGTAVYSCENKDALVLADEKRQDPDYFAGDPDGKILVLNLASATRPGGAVRDGANGQEEDLCRRSSLLLSLESEEAKRYYDYNNELNTHLGSDAVMVSPNVLVVRDDAGELLEEPFEISVLSCSAPMIRFGLEGKSQEEYQAMLEGRIEGILYCAANQGYKNLILGAFGCGVFGNDAAVVSDAFKKALSGPAGAGFQHVDFAVLCKPGKEYNYQEFCRNFGGKE